MRIFLFVILTITLCHNQLFAQALSERSGNNITSDLKGYVFNFSGNRNDNCYHGPNDADNYNFNQFNNPNYTHSLNEELGYLRVNFDGNQTGTMAFHMMYENCFLIENNPSGMVNMSNPSHQFIEARLRSSVDVESLGFYIGTQDENGFFVYGDGTGNTSASLLANVWTTVRLPAIFVDWQDLEIDPTKVLGFGLYVNNTIAPQPNGFIDIDNIRFGSATARINPSGEEYEGGNGFAFSFTEDDQYVCFNNLNVSGNANFDFQVDEENGEGILSELDGSVTNDVFRMNFTDPDCFLNEVDLRKEEDRFIQVKIKSDIDVSSLAIVIAANTIPGGAIEYSKVISTYSLAADEWNELTIPISMKTEFGQQLDSSKIEGVVFIVNPQSPELKTSSSASVIPAKLSFPFLKVGNTEGVTSVNSKSLDEKIKVYPNPIYDGGLINIELDNAGLEYSYSLIDMTGRVLFTNNSLGHKSELNLSGYTKGLYTLKIMLNNMVSTKKIILH